MPEQRLPGLVTRHMAVGAGCALLNIALVHGGTEWLRWPYPLAAMLTCLVTIPTSYFLHRRHSFRVSHSASRREFVRFLGQQLMQFAIGLALLSIGVEWLGLHPTLAMAAATAVLWLLSFVAQWRWVFRAQPRAGQQ